MANDSMVQDYVDLAQARDEAASPSAQLLRLRKTFKPETKAAPVMPEAGRTPPGIQEPGMEMPALRKTGAPPLPTGGIDRRTGETIPALTAARETGPAVLPSAGEVLKAIPGGVLMAAKRLGLSIRDLAAAAHASGVQESEQELADAGLTPEDARAEATAGDPLGSVFIKALTRAANAVPQTGEPESILGGFFKEAVSFLTPFLPFAKAVRAIPEMQTLMKGGAGAKAAGMALEGVIAGLPAGFISVDSANPANLVNALPSTWRPEALEFLAAPPLAEGEEIALEQRFRERLKSSAVGAIAGAPLDMTIGALIAARQALRLKAATRNFDSSVKTALGLQEQRAGERVGAASVEEAAGPLAHDRRKVALPAATERRGQGVVAPDPAVQAVERSMAGQPADKIEAAINRSVGVPDESVGQMVQATIKDGGATFDPRTGAPAPYGDKFVVANTRGGAMRTSVSEFSSSDVAAFRAAHADELLDPDAFHGTWIKDETVYQDVSRRVSTVEEAQKIAARADEPQQMIWDEANNVGIPVTSLHVPGDPSRVVIDEDMARAVYGDDAPDIGESGSVSPKTAFLQTWVRQAADATGVTPAEMNVAARVAVQMELDLAGKGSSTPVFHGTGAAFKKPDMKGGLWVAEQPNTADFYSRGLRMESVRKTGQEQAAPNIRPYFLDPKANLASEDVVFSLQAQLGDAGDVMAELVAKGFDGAEFTGTMTGKGQNYWIFNPKVLKEKFTGEPAADLAPLRHALGRQARQMFEDGTLDVPKDMRDDAGFSRIGMLWFLSRTAAGALFGATGEGTMEDRVAGAIFGGAVGASLSPKLAGQLVKRLARVAEREKAVRAKKTASVQAAGIAGEPIKPEADTFGSLADEYAERVRIATRGEEVNPETGLTTVRPRASQAAEAEVVRQEMTPESIQQLMPTIRMNDSESIAMAHVMNEVGLKVRALAISAKQGGYRPDDVNELLKELYLMGRMDPKRLGALAEAGRTLGALNDPVSGMNQFIDQFSEVLRNANSTVTPQRLADAIASFKTPEELAVFAKQLTKPGFGDYFYEVWINGLLSGPKTLIVNGLGNSTFLLYNIGERGLASSIRSVGGIAPGEATAMLHGIVEAHTDALRAFWAIVRDAEQIPLASKLEAPNKAITAEHLNLTGTPGRAVDLLGSAIRTPGRVLAGTDEYFKGIATRAQLRSLAKREGFTEVEKLGLSGPAAAQKMHDVEQAFLLDPPLGAMQKARQFAEYVTFTRDLGETGQAIQVLQRTPFGRIVVPFVRTPINLAKAGLERSGPLGLASSTLRAELNSADPAVRDLARAKVALSSMTLSTMGVMAANGYVTGGGPQDPVLRKQWLSAGYQPYSFDVGAMLGRVGPPKPGDLVQFSRIDPIAMPWGMVADVVNLMGHLPPDEREELAGALVTAFSKNFTSKTFVQGVARTTAVMADPERLGGTYLKNFLTSTMPFSSLLRQSAQALSPELKDAQGVIEEFQKRFPGAGGSVPNDLDLFGNPRYLGGGLGRDLVGPTFVPVVDFIVPIYVNTASKEHQDIFKILNDNAIRAAEFPKSIDGVVLSNVERAAGVKIAGSEIAPEEMKLPQALRKLFSSPAWKAAAPGRGEGREALANIVIRGYYKGALEVLQDRFKELKRDVRNARVDRARSMGADPREIERVRALIGVD